MRWQEISLDQPRSVVLSCVEVASVVISGKEEAKQAEQWEVGYIFSATELLSLGAHLDLMENALMKML